MKFNTFKQYLSVFIALKDKIEKHDNYELSKLEQILRLKEKELSKLSEKMNQQTIELSALQSNILALEEKVSKLENKSKNIDGWTVRLTSKGYYNLCKSFGGKVESIYIGKTFDKSKARIKIAERMAMLRQKGKIIFPSH